MFVLRSGRPALLPQVPRGHCGKGSVGTAPAGAPFSDACCGGRQRGAATPGQSARLSLEPPSPVRQDHLHRFTSLFRRANKICPLTAGRPNGPSAAGSVGGIMFRRHVYAVQLDVGSERQRRYAFDQSFQLPCTIAPFAHGPENCFRIYQEDLAHAMFCRWAAQPFQGESDAVRLQRLF